MFIRRTCLRLALCAVLPLLAHAKVLVTSPVLFVADADQLRQKLDFDTLATYNDLWITNPYDYEQLIVVDNRPSNPAVRAFRAYGTMQRTYYIFVTNENSRYTWTNAYQNFTLIPAQDVASGVEELERLIK